MNTKPYNETTFNEARMVAVKAHTGQDYDKIFPYEKHLDDVVSVLHGFGYGGRFIVAGYLHDVLEDCPISYKYIKNYFGLVVAEMVYCVTDEIGRNRVEKKSKTLPKIASNPDAIILKLADRIANVNHGGKIDMYSKEFTAFYDALYIPGHADELWNQLKTLLKIK
mgnify:CR=1 FL=1